jgi:putative lipoprotein (rSAM/lipoprotein system)
MSKLNRSFLKKFNAFLIALLAFFGFSSCNNSSPDSEFAIKGQVTNVVDGKGIEGIHVMSGRMIVREGPILMYGTLPIDFNPELATLTDKNGNFFVLVNDTTGGVYLRFSDIDGEENGSFWNDMRFVRFENGKNVANFDIALTPRTDE